MPVNNNFYGRQTGIQQPVAANYYTPQPPQPAMEMPLIYVHGIDGANAYQLPYGVTKQILWDDEFDCFYIKALDQMGRPKVIAWKDFTDHVIPKEPEVTPAGNVDMSNYLTKKDLQDFLSRFDPSKFLTKEDFDRAITQLSVGERGRIVRNEFDA